MCSALTSASLDFPLICIVSAIHAMHSLLLPIPVLAHKVNCVNYSNPFVQNLAFSIPYLKAIRLWLTEHSSIQLYAVGSVLCACAALSAVSLCFVSPFLFIFCLLQVDAAIFSHEKTAKSDRKYG